MLEALPELKGQGFDELLNEVLRSGKPYIGTEVPAKIMRNGKLETSYVNFSYFPMRSEKGDITGIIVLATDVTNEVLARKRFERNEARYRSALMAAKEEAEKERNKLEDLFMQAPAMICVLRGPDHVFELANSLYEQAVATGRSLIGKPVARALPEVVDQGFIELLDTVYKSGQPYIGHEVLIRLDRQGNGKLSECYFNFIYKPLKDAKGKTSGIFVHAVDVTELVHAKQEAEFSEARYKALTEKNTDGISLVSGEGKVIYTSPATQQILGYSQEEFERLANPFALVHEDERDMVFGLFLRLLKNPGETVTVSYRYQHKQGHYVWVDTVVTNLLEDKVINAVLVNYRDVTERKTMEHSLRESEARYRASFYQAAAPMATLSLDAGWIDCNDAFLRYFGYKKSELPNLTLHSLTVAEDHDEHMFDKLKENPSIAISDEKRFVHKTGGILWANLHASLIRDEDGQPLYVMLVLHDTTIRRVAEQTQQRLSEMRELNRTKDEFIALASHQLRTPATAVKQYVHLVMNGFAGELNDHQKQLLQTAYDSNERQLEIIRDLLKTAQIDSREFTLQKEECDLDELVRTTIAGLASALQIQGHEVEYHGPHKPLKAKVDQTEMHLVIANLLENAGKYSKPGKPIRVRLQKDDSKAVISIQDEGVGISKEHQKRIFEKFSRIDNELSDTVTGSGLGLYWVNRIVKLHGGTIAVDSELNKGATFSVRLPL